MYVFEGESIYVGRLDAPVVEVDLDPATDNDERDDAHVDAREEVVHATGLLDTDGQYERDEHGDAKREKVCSSHIC